jgi:hypothetical protein
VVDVVVSDRFGRRELPAIAAATTAATTAAAATTTAVAAFSTAATTTTVAAATTAAVVTAATTAVATTAAGTAATTTTAAEATAATGTEATATAATTAAALLALLGLIHAERATIEGPAVHAFDRLRGLFGSAHRDERESTGPAGLTIGDQVDVADGSEFLERATDAFSIGVERKVSNVQTSVHRLLDLAQVTTVPPRGGHGAPSGGFKTKELCVKLPLSTGPKPTNRG